MQFSNVKGTRMKNTLLRAARRQMGWNQQQLADFAEVSLSTIERAERGKQIRVDNIERLCTCLQKAPEQLGLLETEDQGVSRRQANKTIAGLVGGLLLTSSTKLIDPPLWERLSKTLARHSSVDNQALQGLEHITKSYWQLRSSLGYSSLLKGFIGHLETVEQLMQCTHPPAVHTHLCAITSEIAQHIGAIYFDMSNYPLARSYYKVSIEAATEANNHTLCAVGLGRMSFLPIYSNNPHEAIPLLQEAQEVAMRHSPPQINAWLASVEAEAQANLHNGSSCIQLLSRAERALESVVQDASPHEVKFDYSRLVGYKGTCYLHLQKTKEALSALDEGMKLIDASSVRQRSIIFADAAAAYAHMGEVDAACSSATHALELNRLTKSSLVLQRLQKVRAIMRPWEVTGIVKDFDAQMTLHATLL
jgi:transcriptional regulator with XRE-family HTH domain